MPTTPDPDLKSSQELGRSYGYRKGLPMATVILRYGHSEVTVNALVDSGATRSVFSRHEAQVLGLEMNAGILTHFNAANGAVFSAREFRLEVELAGVRFPARVCFAESALMEPMLLGRLDIFQKFRIEFCEQEGFVSFVPYSPRG